MACNCLEEGWNLLQKLEGGEDKSLLKQCLTEEIFQKLKEKQTSAQNGMFEIIRMGVENPDSKVGVCAPDPEAYSVFAALFNPIIEKWHLGFTSSSHHPESDYGPAETKFSNLDVNRYKFTPSLSGEEFKEIESKIKIALEQASGELRGAYYPLSGMEGIYKQRLIEFNYLFKEQDKGMISAGAYRFWPSSRGIFLNLTKTFAVWVNEQDHLQVMSLQEGGNLNMVYGRMRKGLQFLEKNLEFAKHDRLGYLTFCPCNLGNTIRASVHIMLPKLVNQKKKLATLLKKYKLDLRPVEGDTEIVDISNRRRLGLTEVASLKELQTGIQALIKAEKGIKPENKVNKE